MYLKKKKFEYQCITIYQKSKYVIKKKKKNTNIIKFQNKQ